jgi:hypothetical protein
VADKAVLNKYPDIKINSGKASISPALKLKAQNLSILFRS